MTPDQLDLAAIEGRLAQTRPKAPEPGSCIRNDPHSVMLAIEALLDDDAPELLAEVRRLRAAIYKTSHTLTEALTAIQAILGPLPEVDADE